MVKEDRSDWVAVAPEFAASGASSEPKIKPAQSAYQFFQRDMSEHVKTEYMATHEKFQVGEFSKLLRERWNELDTEKKAHYEDLAYRDRMRFNSESHAADVQAMERKERLRKERETLLLDDEGGTKRSTRRQHAKKERKRERKEQKKSEKQSTKNADDEEFVEDDDDESSDSYEGDSDSDSADSGGANKKKKTAPRPLSQKQIEMREQKQKEKMEKEAIITERQEDVRKERAQQAKRRLEFLLKQSNIFSHFGQVKQDQAKYFKNKTQGGDGKTLSRRDTVDDRQDDDDLEEADTHQATFLTSQPTTLAFGKMREYQLEGLNWMIRLQENGVNGILADEMGLGKTLQSISILVYMLEYQNCTGPHLIVVPKSTLSNWMTEIGRWAPTIKAVKFHGDKENRENIANNVLCPGQRDDDRQWHVCITTYEVCNIEKNVLNKFAWSYLIIDEAHRLKNEASAFSLTVRSFETRYRILLTGTPLQNSLHELWALLNFLVPDVFASSEQFDEWFNLDIEDAAEKNRLISQLHKILRPFMLRRLKKEVEKSLPPKHETILFTGMSAMQKKLYRDILIRDIDALQGNSGNRTAILNIVMQLRKCAGHPYLFPGVEDRTLPPLGEHLVENCGKMVLLDKLLKRLKERGHRVLLFTQMTRLIDILEDYMVMRRYNYCRIDGNTSYELREDYIDAFNAPNSEKFIFLLSTRAGGLGINLQTADVVILYDSDWNPQADLQAQDRAHRIGQKKEVQVFRFVTEHTVEEKIVERAQQKLKLDAMVVQQGRLKEKDKLSRDDLLSAVTFGADKIFKSKDSSITDEDIDLIIDAGKRKTQELNDKLKAADKGDLLDFKLDGGSNLQTFEGVDYSRNALAAAKAESELMHIIDMGKRERKPVANYNENKLYQEQMAAMNGGAAKERKKKKVFKLPKSVRLPRMEEWQMFDTVRLMAIQDEEEKKFRELPEETQKMATMKKEDIIEEKMKTANEEETDPEKPEVSESEVQASIDAFKLPPLLDEETQAEKERLLKEGFVDWTRPDYSAFVKASARYGRDEIGKIALEIGKSVEKVKAYADAFWGDIGKSRFSEHEYDRVIKLIEKGEKKIRDIKALERGTRIFVSLFDNPWEELEFSHVNTKDKLFSPDNDRYLLCWTRKYGFGEWGAVKMAIRRSPKFRFDYFLRSLPVDVLGRRCEHLMRAAVKEVEDLEKKAREAAGLPTVAEEGKELPPIELPPFKDMKRKERETKRKEMDKERSQLEQSVEELEAQMKELQDRLKELSRDISEDQKENVARNGGSHSKKRPRPAGEQAQAEEEPLEDPNGAIGPDGTIVEFPDYDGSEPPREAKKAFTHFCMSIRKEVKQSLNPVERKDKEKVNDILKERWLDLPDEEKETWRIWADWDKKRYARDLSIYENAQQSNGHKSASARGKELTSDNELNLHVPKKGQTPGEDAFAHIPKKKRRN